MASINKGLRQSFAGQAVDRNIGAKIQCTGEAITLKIRPKKNPQQKKWFGGTIYCSAYRPFRRRTYFFGCGWMYVRAGIWSKSAEKTWRTLCFGAAQGDVLFDWGPLSNLGTLTTHHRYFVSVSSCVLFSVVMFNGFPWVLQTFSAGFFQSPMARVPCSIAVHANLRSRPTCTLWPLVICYIAIWEMDHL